MNILLKDLLIASMHQFKKVGRSFPQGFGLNMGEFFIMDRISCGTPCSSTDISDAEMHDHPHFTKPAVSQILNSLEKKEYVHREIDKNDRRKIVVTLTETGEKALGQAKAYFDDQMDQTITQFGEENTRQLIFLVNRLTEITRHLKECHPQEHEKEATID